MPGPRPRRPVGYLGKLEVRKVLPRGGRGRRKVLIRSWPTPIRLKARTELPPEPRKPIHGPAASEWARRVMREAKREKINFGWATKKSLCKVAKGERPLGYSVWHGAEAYMRRIRKEREHERDVRERPMQFRVAPGRGPLIGWRSALGPETEFAGSGRGGNGSGRGAYENRGNARPYY